MAYTSRALSSSRTQYGPVKKHQDWVKAKVIRKKFPRSYEVVTKSGRVLRRNRKDLRSSRSQWDRDVDLDFDEMEGKEECRMEGQASNLEEAHVTTTPTRIRRVRRVRSQKSY